MFRQFSPLAMIGLLCKKAAEQAQGLDLLKSRSRCTQWQSRARLQSLLRFGVKLRSVQVDVADQNIWSARSKSSPTFKTGRHYIQSKKLSASSKSRRCFWSACSTGTGLYTASTRGRSSLFTMDITEVCYFPVLQQMSRGAVAVHGVQSLHLHIKAAGEGTNLRFVYWDSI